MADSAARPAESGPDTITVVAVVRDEVAADRAELHVTVQGSSLVMGDMALTRAREVGQLVADLEAVGVNESDVTLESVRANTSTGLIGKSSSVTYALRIVCRDLKGLADVLGAITSQKNTTLASIVWKYPDDGARWLALLDDCLRQAQDKAVRIAAALGVSLTGVRRFEESRIDPEGDAHFTKMASPETFSRARAMAIGDAELGMEVAHSKRISVRVEIEYRVSGFTNTSKEAAQP